MVIKERTLIVGAAGVVAMMVGVAVWKQITAPPRSTTVASSGSTKYSAEQIQTISTGEEVDLAAHMPASGRTLVEFTAKW